MREFTAPNRAYGIEKGAKRNITFPLHCVFGPGGTKIIPKDIKLITTITGLPQASATALRALCGKEGAARSALEALNAEEKEAAGEAQAGVNGENYLLKGRDSPLHPELPVPVRKTRCVSHHLLGANWYLQSFGTARLTRVKAAAIKGC
jgi:hypothetical protein